MHSWMKGCFVYFCVYRNAFCILMGFVFPDGNSLNGTSFLRSLFGESVNILSPSFSFTRTHIHNCMHWCTHFTIEFLDYITKIDFLNTVFGWSENREDGKYREENRVENSIFHCLAKERKWRGRKTREKVFSPGPTIFFLPNREENLERKVLWKHFYRNTLSQRPQQPSAAK